MTIANQDNRTSAEADNTDAQEIPYLFPTLTGGDLAVYKVLTSTGEPTALVEGAADGYTATYGSTGGTVTITAAIAATYTIHVIRDIDYTQSVNLASGGPWNPETIEARLDHLTKLTIQNRDDNERCLRGKATDTSTDFVLPNESDRASKYLTFDANGKATATTEKTTGAVVLTAFGESLVDDADSDEAITTLNLDDTTDITKGDAYIGVLRTETDAVAQTLHDYIENQPIYVTDFGALGDGSTDDTAAIQAAVDAAINSEHYQKLVVFPTPPKWYVVEGTITMKEGIMLAGEGPQQGVYIYHNVDTIDCLVWDITLGQAARGTGGGLKNMTILKGNGYSGGNAIKLYATDDAHRPGEMVFDNILIYGTGTGLWKRGFYLDGTNCNTVGSKGIRSIAFRKFRCADCTEDNEYILIDQGVHIYGNSVAIDTGDGTGEAGMTITGDSDNVFIQGFNSAGVTKIEDDASQVVISGQCTTLQVNGTSVTGAYTGYLGDLVNKSTGFVIKSARSPKVLTYLSANQALATGDATTATVICNTETFDTNADYDTATGKFTATVAGWYRISYQIWLDALGAGHTRYDHALIHDPAVGGNVTYATAGNPYAMSTTNDFVTGSSVTLKLEYGDAVYLTTKVSNSTKTVNIGGSATRYTFLSLELI